MELNLPYINPMAFAEALTKNYSFYNNLGWNTIHLTVPDNAGAGGLQLFIRNEIHYFRGKWHFNEETSFISQDKVGKKGLIDFRVNNDGQIHSAMIEGDKKFEWGITEVDGFRFFIPGKLLDLQNRQFRDYFEKYCYNKNIIKLQKQIFSLGPEDISTAMLLESKMLEFIHYWINFLRTNEIDCHFDLPSARHLSRIENAKQLLEEHVTEDISIKQISRKIGLNEYDLKRNFKKMYGLSIHQYLIKLRIEQANDMIKNTDLPITEISQLLGYSNRGHFANLYQRYFGKTPLQDRLHINK